jgi:hypothetical protein
MRARSEGYNLREILLTLGGLCCVLWAILLKRETVLNAWSWLVLPALALGLAANARWPKRAGHIYGSGRWTRFLLGLVAHSVAWGGLYAVLLLGLNRAFPRAGSQRTERHAITSRGSMIGKSRADRDKRRPVFGIQTAHGPTEIILPHEHYAHADSIVALETRLESGLFGFEIIRAMEPVFKD